MDKKKIRDGMLISAMFLCTAFTTYGVWSATNQVVSYGGDVTVVSYPHVDASVAISIDDTDLTPAVIDETESKSVHSVAGFSEALAGAMHGNVASSQDDGRIVVDDTALITITLTNTSADYDLGYKIENTNTSVENISVVNTNTSKNGIGTDESEVSTYTLTLDDVALKASGSFAWTITLTAANR